MELAETTSTSVFADDPTDLAPSQRFAKAHEEAPRVEEPLLDSDIDGELQSASTPALKSTVSVPAFDFNSEDAFPALGGAIAPKAKSIWGAGINSNNKVKAFPVIASQVVSSGDLVTEIVKLEASQQQQRKEFGSRNGIGEVARNVMTRTGTTIQMSTAQKTGTSTFLIRGKPEAVAAARRELMKELGKKVRHALA